MTAPAHPGGETVATLMATGNELLAEGRIEQASAVLVAAGFIDAAYEKGKDPLGSTPQAPTVDSVPVPRAEWEALVEACNDDSGSVDYYRRRMTGRAASLVRAARRCGGVQ